MINPNIDHTEILSSLFGGGGKVWGVQQEPVRINGVLRTGNGLIKGSQSWQNDYFGETASFFGF